MAEEEYLHLKPPGGSYFRQRSKMAKRIVLKLDLNCENCKRRAMKTLAGVDGVDSVKIDAKQGKIVVVGDADPVCLTTSLRKFGFAELLSVGPIRKEIEEEDWKQNKGYAILPRSCDRCGGYTYYFREEKTNDCSIL